jgi:hypothetical protein
MKKITLLILLNLTSFTLLAESGSHLNLLRIEKALQNKEIACPPNSILRGKSTLHEYC